MAALCDVYVNDAFGTAHRAEATTQGIAKYAPVACAGPLMAAELDALGKALRDPLRPLVAIVAGSKVSTKLTILKSLAEKVDQLIVGGGIANTFMLAAGLRIGKSLAEAGLVGEAHAIVDLMKARGAQVPLPVDVVVGAEVSARARANHVAVEQVGTDDMILDIGPRSAATLAAMIAKAGTIVWNGPVGVFEYDQFGGGTKAIAEAIAEFEGIFDRRWRRYAGGDCKVRHCRQHFLHLDRRRCISRVSRRQDAAGGGDPRTARRPAGLKVDD